MIAKSLDVVIVAYNRNRLLHRILDALSTQAEDNFNVIVVDDGSKALINPNDYPIVKKYTWTYDDGYHRVARINEAYGYCASPFVLQLDDDCVPQGPMYINAHLDTLARYDISIGWTINEVGPGNVGWFSTVNNAMPLELLRKVGYLDPYYDGAYGHEDRDLGEKFKQVGARFSPYNKGATVKMSGVLGSHNNGERPAAMLERNTRYFIGKWGKHPDHCGLPPECSTGA